MSQISTILNANGREIVTDLQRSMSSKRLDASGDTSRSISYSVEETPTKAILRITANRSIGALQYGRRAGKRPPREAIRKWIDDKPISLSGSITKDQLAFLISRKIGQEGIKVPNRFNPGGVISEVINDTLINKIFREVKEASKNRLIEAARKVKGGFAK